MCGRFVLENSVEVIQDRFQVVQINTPPSVSYNVSPGQDISAIVYDGSRKLVSFSWGLIPFWAKEPLKVRRMINARAETIGEKATFKHAFRKRRCLIPASGFYEWRKSGKRKEPHYIFLKSGKPFGIAGIYNVWTSSQGEESHTCAIVTTEANDLLKPVHLRMPVIVPPEIEQAWLDPGFEEEDRLRSFMKPYPPGDMAFHEVSPVVNSPSNNSPECIKEIS